MHRDGVMVASVDADAFTVHGLHFEEWDVPAEVRARWIAAALDDACAVVSMPFLLGGVEPARAFRDTADPYAYSGMVAPVGHPAAWYGVALSEPGTTWQVRAASSDLAATDVARAFAVGQPLPVVERGQAATVTTFAHPDGHCALHLVVGALESTADAGAVFAVVEVLRHHLLAGLRLGEVRGGVISSVDDALERTAPELLSDVLARAGELDWRGSLLQSDDGRCWLRRPE